MDLKTDVVCIETNWGHEHYANPMYMYLVKFYLGKLPEKVIQDKVVLLLTGNSRKVMVLIFQ